MVVLLSLGLDPSHPDYGSLKRLENKIIEQARGWQRFKRDIPNLIRQGIDEVIDTPRTMRFTFDELEKIEKAYLGIKLKILMRHHLELEHGKVLDVLADGVEIGMLTTSGRRWAVPKVAIGHPYILIGYDERTARCSFGLTVFSASRMMNGLARRRRIVDAEQPHLPVHWMLRDEPYPRNPWEEHLRRHPTLLRILASDPG